MSDLYIPPDITKAVIQSERIAIIGPPGSGKTTSLLSFPNLIIFDLDKKAPAGTTTIPAWNPDWADSVLADGKLNGRIRKDIPNFRDAIKKWLRINHYQFTPSQTFAIDSWSYLQDACDHQTQIEDVEIGMANTIKGTHNDFWFWEQKQNFTREVVKYIMSMKCRVVVTFHEANDRDEQGRLNGKIRPLMSGTYKDYILGAFNNVWRMRPNMPSRDKAGLIKRDADGNPIADTGYFWQLFGNSVIDLNCDPNISKVARKEEITKIAITLTTDGEVTGGYKTIQQLYAKHLT